MSQPRLNWTDIAPKSYKAMAGVNATLSGSTLGPILMDLIQTRVSQINGCAFCLDMHSKDARALGEDEARLHMLAGWREAPVYSERERAALAWCESLTLLPRTGAPDSDYEPLKAHFSDAEIVALSFLIVAINGWNRLAVGFRSPAGEYVSPYEEAADTA